MTSITGYYDETEKKKMLDNYYNYLNAFIDNDKVLNSKAQEYALRQRMNIPRFAEPKTVEDFRSAEEKQADRLALEQQAFISLKQLTSPKDANDILTYLRDTRNVLNYVKFAELFKKDNAGVNLLDVASFRKLWEAFITKQKLSPEPTQEELESKRISAEQSKAMNLSPEEFMKLSKGEVIPELVESKVVESIPDEDLKEFDPFELEKSVVRSVPSILSSIVSNVYNYLTDSERKKLADRIIKETPKHEIPDDIRTKKGSELTPDEFFRLAKINKDKTAEAEAPFFRGIIKSVFGKSKKKEEEVADKIISPEIPKGPLLSPITPPKYPTKDKSSELSDFIPSAPSLEEFTTIRVPESIMEDYETTSGVPPEKEIPVALDADLDEKNSEIIYDWLKSRRINTGDIIKGSYDFPDGLFVADARIPTLIDLSKTSGRFNQPLNREQLNLFAKSIIKGSVPVIDETATESELNKTLGPNEMKLFDELILSKINFVNEDSAGDKYATIINPATNYNVIAKKDSSGSITLQVPLGKDGKPIDGSAKKKILIKRDSSGKIIITKPTRPLTAMEMRYWLNNANDRKYGASDISRIPAIGTGTFKSMHMTRKNPNPDINTRNYRFGSVYIARDPLVKAGMLTVRSSSGKNIKPMVGVGIPSKLRKIIMDIVNESSYEDDDYNSLDDQYKDILDRLLIMGKVKDVSMGCGDIYQKINRIDKNRDELIKEFNLLKGQIIAGNDNNEILKKLRNCMIQLDEGGFISKADYNKAMKNIMMCL